MHLIMSLVGMATLILIAISFLHTGDLQLNYAHGRWRIPYSKLV